MKILSSDGKDFLSIEPRYEPDGIFEVTLSVDGATTTDDDQVLLQRTEFLQALKAFLDSRTGKAVIEGTGDLTISFEADGGSGAVWLWARVNRIVHCISSRTGKGRSGRFSLEAGFTIDGEAVLRLGRDFAKLFDRGTGVLGIVDG